MRPFQTMRRSFTGPDASTVKLVVRMLLPVFASAVVVLADSEQQAPWQRLTDPTTADLALHFTNPPPEYGATVTWGWNGSMTEEAIVRDLEALHAKGLRAATIEAGYRMDTAPYLSEGWFNLVRFAAEEARKRGMRIWIIDEGKYPSGFAGGKFTRERPDLRMQGIAVAERIELAGGETVSRRLSPEVLGVIAVNRDTRETRSLDIVSGGLNWTAPDGQGRWQVMVVDHQFRTSVTRAVNDPTGAKTPANSMGDLINSAATHQFIEWTHEGYRRHMSELFGMVILGFRGDEPDFAYTPWTGDIVKMFQERKGYDPTSYLPYFASFGGRRGGRIELTEQQRQAKADYWDVWSDLFAEHFFTAEAKWCATNGLEYMTHLNNDHTMPRLVISTGDFFKAMRHVQVPGVDAIWNQVWPGEVADFPKFASSAAHLFGRPRALSESFAAYTPPPNVEQVRFGVNYQMVRGINLFEFMFFQSSAGRGPRSGSAASARRSTNSGNDSGGSGRGGGRPRRYLDEPEFKAVAEYANRASYLLAQGRPAAQIAVYFPTTSLWLGDAEANDSAMHIARQLLEHQRDFDFVDEQALATVMRLEGPEFRNLSGQSYRAVIIPSVTAISRAALDRLQAFSRNGGKVFFLGREPSMAVERTFLNAPPPSGLDWATHEPSGELTPAVLTALPPPDTALDTPCPAVNILHRRLRDADLYFIFNESEERQTCRVALAGGGQPQTWDLQSGKIKWAREALVDNGIMRMPLILEGHEARCLLVGAAPPGVLQEP